MKPLAKVAFFLSLLASVVWAAPSVQTVHVYKSPTCECCGKWIDHMNVNGFKVITHEINNVVDQKMRLGVPMALASCHTAEIGGYFIEGHVPAGDIKKLLAEKPDARGLDVPGMPASAPGMSDTSKAPYAVLLVKKDGTTATYARY